MKTISKHNSDFREYTKFITGLKGVSIIMIVIFHLQFLYSSPSDYVYKILAFNSTWVNMFFVLSAFTITAGIDATKIFNFLAYIKKRYMRLAPAYYIMIIFAFITYPFFTTTFDWHNAVYRLIPHALFLNTSPIDQEYQLLFLGVEWYIPVQFWLYVLAPSVVFLFKKNILAFVFILLGSFLLHFNRNYIFTYNEFFDYASSIQNFLWIYFFAMGIQLIRLKKDWKKSTINKLFGIAFMVSYGYFISMLQTTSEKIYLIFLLAMIVYLLWIKHYVLQWLVSLPKFVQNVIDHIDLAILGIILYKYILNWYFVKQPHEFMGVWSVALVLCAYYRPYISRFLFENTLMVWLGSISYEIYLTHFYVLTMVGYIVPKFGPEQRTLIIVPVTLLSSYLIHKIVQRMIIGTNRLRNSSK